MPQSHFPESHFNVGVVVARKLLRSGAWQHHAWLPHAVLPSAPAVASGTPLGGDGGTAYVYAGAFDLVLERTAIAHYRDNLATARPAIWISLQDHGDGFEIGIVTADPYEGEALTEAIGATVEAVPMPEALQAAIRAFVEAFHVERPFVKRKRDRAAPESRSPRAEAAPHGQ